jgi:hypothetical protein
MLQVSKVLQVTKVLQVQVYKRGAINWRGAIDTYNKLGKQKGKIQNIIRK